MEYSSIQALRMCLKLTFQYELHILLNTKVSAANDHGQICMKERPPPVCHLLRIHLLQIVIGIKHKYEINIVIQ